MSTESLGIVSIIMPVYNGGDYISEAIESVINQSYPHWELGVIDDGSTDATAQIVNSYSDPRIHYFYQQNRGQASALNQGLKNSRGEYITTLDADDWLTADSLLARVEFLSYHPQFAVAYGDGLYCNEAGEALLRFSHHMPTGVYGDVFDKLIVSPFFGTGAAVLIRTEAIRKLNPFYDDAIVWCQDWDFYIRLAQFVSFGFVRSVVIRYRIHSSSMTINMPGGKRLESLIRLRKKVLTSEKFQGVTNSQKSAFFYDFLVKDLHGRTSEQEAVFQNPSYKSMSPQEQAKLYRLTALSYLDLIDYQQIVKNWLHAARDITPFDLKTLITYALFELNPAIARRIIRRWQSRQAHHQTKSPFEMAAISQQLR